MSARPWIIAMLVRCYPAFWRREYGPELEDLLARRPLTVGTVLNVVWHGLVARGRYPTPAEEIGLILMALEALTLVFDARAAMHFSPHRLPAVEAIPVGTTLYFMALATCGYVTRRRYGGSASEAGLATIEVAALTGAPVMLLGLLMLVGALPLFGAPSASSVLTAPLFRLPEAWLWGAIGGSIARKSIARTR